MAETTMQLDFGSHLTVDQIGKVLRVVLASQHYFGSCEAELSEFIHEGARNLVAFEIRFTSQRRIRIQPEPETMWFRKKRLGGRRSPYLRYRYADIVVSNWDSESYQTDPYSDLNRFLRAFAIAEVGMLGTWRDLDADLDKCLNVSLANLGLTVTGTSQEQEKIMGNANVKVEIEVAARDLRTIERLAKREGMSGTDVVSRIISLSAYLLHLERREGTSFLGLPHQAFAMYIRKVWGYPWGKKTTITAVLLPQTWAKLQEAVETTNSSSSVIRLGLPLYRRAAKRKLYICKGKAVERVVLSDAEAEGADRS